MKKQFIILLLFSTQVFGQKDPNPHFPKLKISVPCNQEFLETYKGKWLIPGKTFPSSLNNNYSQAAMNRITQIHGFVKQIYPQPMGSDAYWRGSYSISDFAYTIKYVTEDGRTQKEYLKRRQVEGWSYYMILFAWSCTENANEIENGYPDVSGLNIVQVDANRLQVLNGEFMDDDGWTINGQPIKRKMPVIGKWKGYDVMAVNGGQYADQNDDWFILVIRDGMLPYIPVTRKQYLDRAIAYATKFYDKMIAYNDAIPDKAERDETKNRNLKMKNDALKKLQDELEKITKDGSLNAPAVVGTDPLLMNEGPIFLPEANGGIMLTIENPEYFRKDLPAYVPQIFAVSWNKNGKPKWCADFKSAIEENFPIEKLKAMIDK